VHLLDASLPFHALAIIQHGGNLVFKAVNILLEEGMHLSHPGIVLADDFLNGRHLLWGEIEIPLQFVDDALWMRTWVPQHPKHPILEESDRQPRADKAAANEGESRHQPAKVKSAIGADGRLARVLCRTGDGAHHIIKWE
jgi:hypothetical protein